MIYRDDVFRGFENRYLRKWEGMNDGVTEQYKSTMIRPSYIVRLHDRVSQRVSMLWKHVMQARLRDDL